MTVDLAKNPLRSSAHYVLVPDYHFGFCSTVSSWLIFGFSKWSILECLSRASLERKLIPHSEKFNLYIMEYGDISIYANLVATANIFLSNRSLLLAFCLSHFFWNE